MTAAPDRYSPRRASDAIDLVYLESVCERAKSRRKTLFGLRKTTEAEAAEAVLVVYAPALIRELRRRGYMEIER